MKLVRSKYKKLWEIKRDDKLSMEALFTKHIRDVFKTLSSSYDGVFCKNT